MYISEIMTTVPENVKERVPLEQEVYKVFAKLGIQFERVDNDPASSMEECKAIGEVLDAPVRKDVFLCNQKKTSFFLLVMPDHKAFDTASFSKKAGGFPYVLCLAGAYAGAYWMYAWICQCSRASQMMKTTMYS